MLRDPALIPLSRQHHSVLALCVFVLRDLEGDGSEENVARQAERITGQFTAEIGPHFQIEEKILFPGVEQALGPQPLIAELLTEHRQVEEIVGGLGEAPSRGGIDDFVNLMRRHVRREEGELFEQVQARLPKEALERIGREVGEAAGAPWCDPTT